MRARLNLSTGKLTVALGNAASPLAILQAGARSGIWRRAVRGRQRRWTPTEREGRFLLHCLAVAGFGTIFTMGLTDAIWYGGDDMSPALRQTFFWLAGTVAIPVIFYSGQPFFLSAWAVLKKRGTNMDVPISLALLLSLGLSLYQTAKGGQRPISTPRPC